MKTNTTIFTAYAQYKKQKEEKPEDQMTKNFLNLSFSNILPNSLCLCIKKFKFCIPLKEVPLLSPPPLPPPPLLSLHLLLLLGHSGRMTGMQINTCIIEKYSENCFPFLYNFCFHPIFTTLLGLTLSNKDPGYCRAR